MTLYDFCKPSAAALERSESLRSHLQQEIVTQNGVISFASFMQTALYHPRLGYYSVDTFELGPRGDFTTAPLISPLFAKCFARQCSLLFSSLAKKNILELGAGTGHFAYELLLELKQNYSLPEHYFIYEISASLRQKQQNFLQKADPLLFSRCVWLTNLPENFIGIVIANEVLDALPVHCFYVAQDEIAERGVALGEEGQFAWQVTQALSADFMKKTSLVYEQCELYPGYQSEINLALPEFIHRLVNSMEQGLLLFADYGYGRLEYYHPERNKGTLTCFYQHHRHDNPLLWPGLFDITAHVDFTSVIESAAEHGCTLAGFTSQAGFLLSCGLMELAEAAQKNLTAAQEFDLHQAIKRLTLPNEMGERSKVMAISKNLCTTPLLGFRLQDRRRDL